MIGWGIIGVGDVTEVKANASIFNADGSRLVHVMRRTGDLARDYAERHGVPRWSDNATAVIDDPQVSVVYIATPTSSHREYTLAALAAGKHVLVEKPIAMDAVEAEQMVAAAKAADRRLWVAYYRRALPRCVKIRELVDGGEIGEVLGARVIWTKPGRLEGWRWDPALNRGGEFLETCCHTFDFLDQLLGPASNASGQVGDGFRTIAASWTQGSVPLSGSWAFGTDDAAEFCELFGTRGTLRFSVFAPGIRITRQGRVDDLMVPDPPHVHGPLVATIIDELQGRAVCPSTGSSALRTARTLDAILG